MEQRNSEHSWIIGKEEDEEGDWEGVVGWGGAGGPGSVGCVCEERDTITAVL